MINVIINFGKYNLPISTKQQKVKSSNAVAPNANDHWFFELFGQNGSFKYITEHNIIRTKTS